MIWSTDCNDIDRQKQSDLAGFTLVEMLITLAILGSLTASVMVALAPVRDRSLIARSSATITEMVARARASSIRQGRPILMRFEPIQHSILIDEIRIRARLDPSVTLTATTASEAGTGLEQGILFLPDGTASGARLQLAIVGRPPVRTLRISWLTGMVVDER